MDRLDRLAELIVRVGANVQPGQVVFVTCEPGQEAASRAIAAACYRLGARFVDVDYFDPWVKHIRVEHAAEDTLDWVPPWYGDRARALGEIRAAVIALNGTVAPTLFDDLDPALVAKDRLPSLKEYIELVNERTINWCVAPCPTQAWAELAYPELEPGEALEALWQRGRARLPPRRGRPGRGLGGAARSARQGHLDARTTAASTRSTSKGRERTSPSGSCRPAAGRAGGA